MRLDDLRWDIKGHFWYALDGTEITPHRLLEYAIHLKSECNRLYGIGQEYDGEVEQLNADLAASVRQCVQLEADLAERTDQYHLAHAKIQALKGLQDEIEPHALRLEPEVVVYRATPNLSSLADWVERFLTIMRNTKD